MSGTWEPLIDNREPHHPAELHFLGGSPGLLRKITKKEGRGEEEERKRRGRGEEERGLYTLAPPLSPSLHALASYAFDHERAEEDALSHEVFCTKFWYLNSLQSPTHQETFREDAHS
jgi:hypothetical protein